MSFTAEQVAEYYRRQGRAVPEFVRAATAPFAQAAAGQVERGELPAGVRSRHEAGTMNPLECRYRDEVLLPLVEQGGVAWWGFEKIKLRLAKKTFYTPDFWMILRNGKQVVDEVKGYWEDDARVKIKLAAEQFPYLHFRAWTYDRKTKVWRREDF